MGLSKVRRPRTRDISRNIVKPITTEGRRQRLSYFPNVFTRLPQTNPQTSNNEKSNKQYHSHSTVPENSQVPPPLQVAKDQSEASGATRPPSITWHARPLDVYGTPIEKAELILQPAKTWLGRRTYATLKVPSGLDWDLSCHGRSISHLLDQVKEEVKDKTTGPFWNRKYPNLNDAVTKVIASNEVSRRGTPGGAWIGVTEENRKLSAWYVYKEDWKGFGVELKDFWDTQIKPATNRCLSSVQSRG